MALGAAGGWLFFQFRLPLAWMLGSMCVCIVGALLRAPLEVPMRLLPFMIAIIGVMLGSGFTPDMFHDPGRWVMTMTGLAVLMVVAGFISVWFLRKVAGYDLATAYFSGMPGGITEMVIAGEEKGGDGRRIALAHSARIFIVVFTLPFIVAMLGFDPTLSTGQRNAVSVIHTPILSWLWLLFCVGAGLLIARMLRFPAPFLVGPMVVSAIAHGAGLTDFKAPGELIIFAQIVMGSSVGCRFLGIRPVEILRVLGYSLACNGAVLAITLAFAILVGSLSGMGTMPLFLAYSPGGLTEMSLMGLAFNVEASFVVLHHIVRVIVVMFSAATVFAAVARLRKPDNE